MVNKTVLANAVSVGTRPSAVALIADGTHAYVTNSGSNNVSVITSNNAVGNSIAVGNTPSAIASDSFGVGIMPPGGVSFSAFSATLAVDFGSRDKRGSFDLQSRFTLRSNSVPIDPVGKPLTIQVGGFRVTIPFGSFKGTEPFHFAGRVNGADLVVLIQLVGPKSYALNASASGANLAGTKNPVLVTLTFDDDSVAASVKAPLKD